MKITLPACHRGKLQVIITGLKPAPQYTSCFLVNWHPVNPSDPLVSTLNNPVLMHQDGLNTWAPGWRKFLKVAA